MSESSNPPAGGGQPDFTKRPPGDQPSPDAPQPGGQPPAYGGQPYGGQPPAYGGQPYGGQPPAYGGQPYSGQPPAYGGQPYGGMPAPPPGFGGPPAPYGYGLQLPPGVELAGRGRRIGAFFLMIVLYVVTLVIGFWIWGLISWTKGTSPALSVLKCKVVDANTGQLVGFGRMALRDIVGGIAQGILSGLTLLVSFVLFLATDKRQSLQDLVGTTVVVHDPNGVLAAR